MKAFGFILLIALLWLRKTLGLNQIYADLCEENHGEFLQHFKDCRKFIRCSHNQAYELQCPGNLLWHHKIKSCDFSYRTKCEIKETAQQVKKSVQEITVKPVSGSKFKREIKKYLLNNFKEDDENLKPLQLKNYFTKTIAQTSTPIINQKSLIDPKKATTISSLKQNIHLTKLNLMNYSRQSILPITKLQEFTKKEDFKTTLRCIKAKISTKNMLPELTTVKIKTEKQTQLSETTDTSVTLPTNMLGVITDILETNPANLITEQTELSETTDTSVTFSTKMLKLLTEEVQTNSVNLITEQTELSETKDTSVTLSTDMLELVTEKLETNAVNLKMEQTELSETKDTSVTFATKMLKLLTEEVETNSVNLITEQTELSETKDTSVTLSTEMLELVTEKLETNNVNLKMEQTELSETKDTSVTLSTEMLEMITEKLKTNTVNLITEQIEISETNDTSVTLSTEILKKLTGNLVNLTETIDLTEQTELTEFLDNYFNITTDSLVNLTETSVNLPTSAEKITDKLHTINTESTTYIFDNLNNNLVNFTTENFVNSTTTTPELAKDNLNATTVKLTTDKSELTTENLITVNFVNLTENSMHQNADTVKVTTEEQEFIETADFFAKLTENIINLTTEIPHNLKKTELPNDRQGVSTVNLTDKSLSVTENSVNLSLTLENLFTTSNNLVQSSLTERSPFSINTTNENLLEVVNLLIHSTDYQKLNDNKAIISKDNILPEISGYLQETENKYEITESKENLESFKNSVKTTTETKTEINQNSRESLTEFPVTTTDLVAVNESTLNVTKASENSLTSTPIYFTLDSSTTLDPRLPFRSPECQGNNNRRQFKALNCYQYYQCFAGWAFLLNCHDGWLFQTSVGECIQDVNNECKV